MDTVNFWKSQWFSKCPNAVHVPMPALSVTTFLIPSQNGVIHNKTLHQRRKFAFYRGSWRMETVQPTQSDFQELFDLPVKTPRAHTTALAEILQLPNAESKWQEWWLRQWGAWHPCGTPSLYSRRLIFALAPVSIWRVNNRWTSLLSFRNFVSEIKKKISNQLFKHIGDKWIKTSC